MDILKDAFVVTLHLFICEFQRSLWRYRNLILAVFYIKCSAVELYSLEQVFDNSVFYLRSVHEAGFMDWNCKEF